MYGSGSQRMFGEFKCPKCNRRWMSANTWPKYGQKCTNCNIYVYPHTQVPLEKSDGMNKSNPKRPHPQDLCQKCQSLGYYCG